jgi:NAD(P)H-dependent flavin oxidoreductase YrpB (nitropropane dioxygenase family)
VLSGRAGQLPELLDVIIEEKASLFVCAVGVPPKFAVEKLHAAGIPIMNVSAGCATRPPACADCAATDGRAPQACSCGLLR